MLEAWETLSPPTESGARNVLLADSSHPLDFRIGQDSRGHYVFLLDADRPAGGIPALPKVMGISIELEEPKAGRARLVLCLQDKADLRIFSHMCTGLMLATRSNAATRSSEGFVRTLEELHRWHEMLKRRLERRLTRSERIGLVGELLFLRDELLPRMGLTAALHAWTGHERHEQDFVVGSTIFEVKTQVVTADRMIAVSSEDQLDPVQGRILICNQGIAPAPKGAAGSCTLNSIAKELADLAKATGGAASDLLGIGYLGGDTNRTPNTRRRRGPRSTGLSTKFATISRESREGSSEQGSSRCDTGFVPPIVSPTREISKPPSRS